MNVRQLVKTFMNSPEQLTYEQVRFILNNEEHEIFAYDYGLYRDIQDYADYLEMEMEA